MFEALPKWVIFHELVLTSKEYMRNVIEIDPKRSEEHTSELQSRV
jgi:hypothetical protein